MTRAPENNRASGNLAIVLWISMVLAMITWFAFGQTLRHEFINRDDPGYIVENPEVSKGLTLHGIAWAFSHSYSYNWHPLTTLTHMLDCQLYGLRAGGHHCTNVLLHILGVVLLFLVLRAMTGALWPSAFVAAVFAIHPLHVESVAWVAERKDVLSGVFFMLTLAAYLRYVHQPSFASYLLVVLVFALGLMSKPMLVTLPLVLLLLDYWPLGRFTARAVVMNNAKSLSWWDLGSIPWKLIWEKIPLLVLSAISCGITLLVQEAMSSIGHVPLRSRVYNALVSYVSYIWQMFWPAKLALEYPYPSGGVSLWTVVLAMVVLLALTTLAWALRKEHPYFITGWLWYLGMLVPVIGLLQVGAQARADRYTYLPQIGLYLLVVWGMMDLSASWRHGRRILSALAITAIVVLSWRAWIQTSYWKNSESIWTRTLAVTSSNAIAHENLGYVLLQRWQLDDGISHLQESLKIRGDFKDQANRDNAQVHFNLGTAFLQKRLVGKAMSHYQMALKLRPELADPHYNFNNFSRALTFNHIARVLSTCSDAQYRDGPRAIEMAERANQLSGWKNSSFVRTLAAAYAESGRFNDAIDTAQRALQLAITQGDPALATELRLDIDLYRMNFPMRESGSSDLRLLDIDRRNLPGPTR
jgi:protein O-mannosyl-transferase